MLIFLALSVMPANQVYAEQVSRDRADSVCANFVFMKIMQNGDWGGSVQPGIESSEILQSDGRPLASMYTISPAGFVLVSMDDRLPPVKAWSDEHNLDELQSGGFVDLIATELSDKLIILSRNSLSYYSDQWAILCDRDLVLNRMNKGGQAVGPLLTSSWHQAGPYNRDCPEGDGGRCLVGCVASAMAQIVNYWQWPPHGAGSLSYIWDGDNSCGDDGYQQQISADFSDPYDWDNMIDSCENGCWQADSSALAELGYETAVAMQTQFGVCNSAANVTEALEAYREHFSYSSSAEIVYRNSMYSYQWDSILTDEIDAGRPVHYFIPGHSVVIDGYNPNGLESEFHINYGWGGPFSAWYILDSIPRLSKNDKMTSNDYAIINIRPQTRPVLSITDVAIIDSLGDSDGHADVGETFEVAIRVENDGYDALDVTGFVSSDDPHLIFLIQNLQFEDILSGAEKLSSNSVLMAVSTACPDPHIAPIYIAVNSGSGDGGSDTLLLYVGDSDGFADDFENGQGFWDAYTPESEFVQTWHIESYNPHSPSTCWKAGGIGNGDYNNNSYSCLVSPPILLPPAPRLRFWYDIDAQLDPAGTFARDGGFVMISQNSFDWELLTPDGGYPYLGQFGRCFSGDSDGWQQTSYDLQGYAGVVWLMFVFRSDQSITGEGWYIDDISVDSDVICGDANSDRSIDISDAIYILNHVFSNGPAPEPVCSGNANGDNSVDVSDVVILINHVFNHGPAPLPGCCE